MISHPEFGVQTTATEVANAFSHAIRDRTILITGISPKSLGEALAFSLAAHSPSLLLLASRTASKLALVSSSIKASHPATRIVEIPLDLASLESVRGAAALVVSVIGAGALDVLFDNAGVNVSERRLTEDGTELQFGTNHVGPFLLTNLLLPLLARSKDGRVVITSSESHRISPIRFSDFNMEPGKQVPGDEEPRRGLPEGILRGDGGYEPGVAYGQSKTANVLFAVGINDRAGSKGVKGFAVHPGTIMTDLGRDLDTKTMQGLVASTEVWKTADQGAATLVVAGFDPKLESADGVYLDDCQLRRPSKWAYDAGKAERLWVLSEELVQNKFNHGRESKM